MLCVAVLIFPQSNLHSFDKRQEKLLFFPHPLRTLFFPSRSASDASASSTDTVAIGLCNVSASPLIALSPTRNPVNDPGPDAAANPPRSFTPYPCFLSKAASVGINCAENVPPAIAADSITRNDPASASASVMPPDWPDVSMARMSICCLSRAERGNPIARINYGCDLGDEPCANENQSLRPACSSPSIKALRKKFSGMKICGQSSSIVPPNNSNFLFRNRRALEAFTNINPFQQPVPLRRKMNRSTLHSVFFFLSSCCFLSLPRRKKLTFRSHVGASTVTDTPLTLDCPLGVVCVNVPPESVNTWPHVFWDGTLARA